MFGLSFKMSISGAILERNHSSQSCLFVKVWKFRWKLKKDIVFRIGSSLINWINIGLTRLCRHLWRSIHWTRNIVHPLLKPLKSNWNMMIYCIAIDTAFGLHWEMVLRPQSHHKWTRWHTSRRVELVLGKRNCTNGRSLGNGRIWDWNVKQKLSQWIFAHLCE